MKTIKLSVLGLCLFSLSSGAIADTVPAAGLQFQSVAVAEQYCPSVIDGEASSIRFINCKQGECEDIIGIGPHNQAFEDMDVTRGLMEPAQLGPADTAIGSSHLAFNKTYAGDYGQFEPDHGISCMYTYKTTEGQTAFIVLQSPVVRAARKLS